MKRQQHFAIVWDNQSTMFPEQNTLTDFMELDRDRGSYGKGEHFFVPREYA